MGLSLLLNTAAIAFVSALAPPSDTPKMEPVMDTIVPERSAGERRRLDPGQLGTIIDLTPAQKQEFVDQHNKWRNRAALGELTGGKKAKQMPKVYWDEEIAEHAKRFSHTCRWEHSSPLGWNELHYGVGENLYAGWGQSDHITAALNGWAEEHVGYNHDTTDCSIEMCGHYTAIVWEHTTRIGCAMTLCDSVSGLSNGKRYYVICQYYRAGNYRDQLPYSYDTNSGGGCSTSEYGATGVDSTYSGLCNNGNDICGRDKRCSAAQDCTSSEPLGGEDSVYTCAAPKCHYDEFPGYQIRNPWPTGNGMFTADNNWMYLQTQQQCKDWCYQNKDGTPGCVGCTQAHNQPASLWFPVINVDAAEREQINHQSGSQMTLLVMDCSEPGADPTPRPTMPPHPTNKPTMSPTLPESYDCASTTTLTNTEIRWPYSTSNGLSWPGGWKYCYKNLETCVQWCKENRFSAPCEGVTTNSENPDFFFPVRTVAASERVAVAGGTVTMLECSSVAPETPSPPPTEPPVVEPTEEPTAEPTFAPTPAPTSSPTDPPTNPPTGGVAVPTFAPTEQPTRAPTSIINILDVTSDDYGCYLKTLKKKCKKLAACRWINLKNKCIPYTCKKAKRPENCLAVSNCHWDYSASICFAYTCKKAKTSEDCLAYNNCQWDPNAMSCF